MRHLEVGSLLPGKNTQEEITGGLPRRKKRALKMSSGLKTLQRIHRRESGN